MDFFRQVMVIAAKDLRAELRTKEAINGSLAFALVILLLFAFAFDPTGDTTREISGGLLWIVFAFAGTLILNRSFARELPNDCLDALIAAPIIVCCSPWSSSRCPCSASSTTSAGLSASPN
jgi:heme exporter protein B